MNLGMILFFTIFLSIYGMLNFIVLFSFAKLFGMSTNYVFFILFGFLTVSFIASSMLVSKYSNNLTKLYYLFSTTWMGVAFISLCVIICYLIVAQILTFASIVIPSNFMYIIPWIVLGIVVVLSGISLYNTSIIKIETINLTSEKISSPIRIVHLTDLHLGAIYGHEHVKKVVLETNALNPDVVLITGDLIDGRYSYDKETFKEFDKINAPIYFTLGNHERYPGLELITNLISGTKIKLLRNEQTQFGQINIIGVDDSDDKKQLPNILTTMDIDVSKYNLIMYHRPLGYKDSSKYADFMLAGHTHAGQIWPFTYLSKMANDGAVYGLYSVKVDSNNSSMRPFLYVGPGTGTWGPKMRLGTQNQITLIVLKANN